MSIKTKAQLNTDIDTDITTNGSNDITGLQVNAILGNMVDSYEDFVGSYTTAQIAALAGMTTRQIVYDTTLKEYYFYDGTLWKPMSGIYLASLNIPTASVLTLNATPLTIVAAAGVSKYIEVLSASFKATFNSVAYATNTSLVIQTATATDHQFISGNALNFTTSCFKKFVDAANNTAGGSQIVANQPVQVKVDTGNPTAGNSDITVYVSYRIRE